MSTKKILIIDDDLRHDKMMSYLLISKGFEPSYVLSGEEAIKMLEEKEIELPCVILMDIMMPGLNGFETLAKLREKFDLSEVPVIMISAVADQAEQKKAAELGASDFIEKPFSPSDIIKRINRALGESEEEQEEK